MSDSPSAPIDKRTTIEGEHRVQQGLINALCAAAENGQGADEIGQILGQLLDYSRAHFMSEELLMRLDSYEGFDEHVEDHGLMLEALDNMRRDLDAGRNDLLSDKARSMLSFLNRHIETRDSLYAAWVPV